MYLQEEVPLTDQSDCQVTLVEFDTVPTVHQPKIIPLNKQGTNTSPCDGCSVNTAMVLCHQCKTVYCTDCHHRHDMVPRFSDHTCDKLDTLQFCGVHHGELISQFCNTCHVTMCLQCLIGTHCSHDTQSLETALEVTHSQLSNMINVSKNISNEASDYANNVNLMVASIKRKEARFERVAKDANCEFEKLSQSLDKITKDYLGKIAESKDTLEEKLRQIECGKENVEKATRLLSVLDMHKLVEARQILNSHETKYVLGNFSVPAPVVPKALFTLVGDIQKAVQSLGSETLDMQLHSSKMIVKHSDDILGKDSPTIMTAPDNAQKKRRLLEPRMLQRAAVRNVDHTMSTCSAKEKTGEKNIESSCLDVEKGDNRKKVTRPVTEKPRNKVTTKNTLGGGKGKPEEGKSARSSLGKDRTEEVSSGIAKTKAGESNRGNIGLSKEKGAAPDCTSSRPSKARAAKRKCYGSARFNKLKGDQTDVGELSSSDGIRDSPTCTSPAAKKLCESSITGPKSK